MIDLWSGWIEHQTLEKNLLRRPWRLDDLSEWSQAGFRNTPIPDNASREALHSIRSKRPGAVIPNPASDRSMNNLLPHVEIA